MQILNDTFAMLLTEYVGILRKAGTYAHIHPTGPCLDHFRGLDFATKNAVLQRVQNDLDLLSEMLEANHQLTSPSLLIKAYLGKSGCSVALGLFDRIEEDDVVCVYDGEQKQIFQSLKFFDFVAVDLGELFCASWFDHRHVNEASHELVRQSIREVLEGRHPDGLAPNVSEYAVKRSDHSANFDFFQHVRWLAPVNQEKRVAGAIAINKFRKPTLAASEFA